MEYQPKGGSSTSYGTELPATVGRETPEDLNPRYIFRPRLVGRLALGELAIEPVLGPVRVAEVVPSEMSGAVEEAEFMHIRWRDEHGPGTAQGRYTADRSFEARMPAQEDRRLVRHGIDQAQWHRREITNDVARLISAHLHPGAGSSMHRFMSDGGIEERIYDELDLAARHRLYARDWINAFTRYCLAREDAESTGPIEIWVVHTAAHAQAELRAEEWLTAAGVNVEELEQRVNGHAKRNGTVNGGETGARARHAGLLARKTMRTETAVELIEAAFQLGMEMGRSGRTRRVRRLLGQQATKAA